MSLLLVRLDLENLWISANIKQDLKNISRRHALKVTRTHVEEEGNARLHRASCSIDVMYYTHDTNACDLNDFPAVVV
jgi:hypothetical protein